jgi:hypothetical protein
LSELQAAAKRKFRESLLSGSGRLLLPECAEENFYSQLLSAQDAPNLHD